MKGKARKRKTRQRGKEKNERGKEGEWRSREKEPGREGQNKQINVRVACLLLGGDTVTTPLSSTPSESVTFPAAPSFLPHTINAPGLLGVSPPRRPPLDVRVCTRWWKWRQQPWCRACNRLLSAGHRNRPNDRAQVVHFAFKFATTHSRQSPFEKINTAQLSIYQQFISYILHLTIV